MQIKYYVSDSMRCQTLQTFPTMNCGYYVCFYHEKHKEESIRAEVRTETEALALVELLNKESITPEELLSLDLEGYERAVRLFPRKEHYIPVYQTLNGEKIHVASIQNKEESETVVKIVNLKLR